MATRLINEQTIFYFTHDEVKEALMLAVSHEVPEVSFKTITISSGLSPNNGLTLCYQRPIEVHSK